MEALRYSYADRNSYLGDPDFVRNPIENPSTSGTSLWSDLHDMEIEYISYTLSFEIERISRQLTFRKSNEAKPKGPGHGGMENNTDLSQ